MSYAWTVGDLFGWFPNACVKNNFILKAQAKGMGSILYFARARVIPRTCRYDFTCRCARHRFNWQ
jgi:hypothetical protein